MERHRRALWFGICAAILTLAPLAAHAQPAQAGSNACPKTIAKVDTDEDRTAGDWRVLSNTAILAAGVALFSVPIGTLLALLLFRTDVPGRRVAMAAIVFLLFLPLYVQVGGWEAAIGKLGWLTPLIENVRLEIPSDDEKLTWPKPPLLSGMRAVIFLHSLVAIPWVVLIVSAGLRLVRREEEEVALLDASGPQVIAGIVLPQIAPFALAAGLLVAIAAAGEMTVTNIYLVDPGDYTLAEQVYMTLQSEPLATAVRQSAPSIAATVLLVAIGWCSVSGLVRAGRTLGNPQQPLVYSLGNWKWPATLLVWTPLAAAIGLPLVSLAYKAGTLVIWDGDVPTRTWSAFKCMSMPWTGLWSVRSDVGWTVAFAAAAATLDVAVAIGVTYFVRAPVLKNAVAVALAAVAFALPGPVVGLIIIGLMNHNLAGIGWLYERTDLPTILAQGVRALPIVMLMVLELLSRFPTGTLEAAKLDGAGTWSILIRIVIPQRAKALMAAWLAGFAIAAGDLAWSILVLRPGVDTLQRRLFGDIHAGADDRVAAICLATGILYGAGAAAILWLQRARR
jgi:iron(III) transport system permease protein